MFKNSEFIKSITDYRSALVDLPNVLLIGRSNVGKSSFINSIANRKSLARVSATPGKTVTLNYYIVDNAMYLVDAPGYGYARRSKSQKNDFITMIDEFVRRVPTKYVFQLMDFKVGPTKEDIEVYEYIKSLNLNLVVILTKYDKVISSMRAKQEKLIKEKLSYPLMFLTSTSMKKGYDKIYDLLTKELGE